LRFSVSTAAHKYRKGIWGEEDGREREEGEKDKKSEHKSRREGGGAEEGEQGILLPFKTNFNRQPGVAKNREIVTAEVGT
jgi:hypothetical protein